MDKEAALRAAAWAIAAEKGHSEAAAALARVKSEIENAQWGRSR